MNPTKADLTEHQIQACVMEWASLVGRKMTCAPFCGCGD